MFFYYFLFSIFLLLSLWNSWPSNNKRDSDIELIGQSLPFEQSKLTQMESIVAGVEDVGIVQLSQGMEQIN